MYASLIAPNLETLVITEAVNAVWLYTKGPHDA
jgi:hypothetical protein